MSSIIRFTSTKLTVDRTEKLIPDSKGYYKIIIGALNVNNASGNFYTGGEDVVALFNSSSDFQRRINNGYLRGELGHPTRLPNQSMNDFINRCLVIDERNVCAHFSEVSLDFDTLKETTNGNKAIAIVARVAPSGIKAESLERGFNNVDENVAFSLRGFTEDARNNDGSLIRTLKTVVTFDNVGEPGIRTANSFDTQQKIGLESLEERIVTEEAIKLAIESNSNNSLVTESSILLGRELLNSISGKFQLKTNFNASISRW